MVASTEVNAERPMPRKIVLNVNTGKVGSSSAEMTYTGDTPRVKPSSHWTKKKSTHLHGDVLVILDDGGVNILLHGERLDVDLLRGGRVDLLHVLLVGAERLGARALRLCLYGRASGTVEEGHRRGRSDEQRRLVSRPGERESSSGRWRAATFVRRARDGRAENIYRGAYAL